MFNSTRRSYRLAAFALAVTVSLTVSSAIADIEGLEATEKPVADPKQSYAIQLINHLIEKSHYRKRQLDDEFSETVLENYLERLDPARNVFVQSDIDQFQTLRHQFDDFIRGGALHPVFLIFDILRTRITERVEYALRRLESPFNFSLDEQYQFDREDAQWAISTSALDDLWRQRIKNDILNLRLADKDEDEIVETLTRRYTDMARRIRQFKSEDVFQIFANAYSNAIEPHTGYFSPRASENFQIQMRLSLVGIGAVLQTDNEYTQVRRIIPGGPADLGRELKADDRIIGVAQGDDEMVDVIGWRLDDVVELIRGEKATTVRLEILSGEEGLSSEPKIISMQRDKINLEEQAAKKRILHVDSPRGDHTIGVIDLPSFYVDFEGMRKKEANYRSTTRDVRKLIKEMEDEENIDGLIIDLRGNGGGALPEAISLTGLFIKEGPVVQVRGTGGRVKVDRDPDPELVYDGPLAVLIDRYSASASEIFAGAIQDYRRGIIIGEPTYGKGTVQHLLDLDRYAKDQSGLGRLKLTTAQFFRINGDSTQLRGVIPDIAWPVTDDEESGERVYENSIPWQRIQRAKYAHFRAETPAAVLETLRRKHESRIRTDAEIQYILDVETINSERRQKKFVSLNQAARERERKHRDAQQLALENRKRRALGEAEAESVEALDDEREAELEAAEANPDAREVDAFLREGGNILSDYMRALALADAEVGTVAKQNQNDSATTPSQ